jgi:predicted 2-oxoglutarate/Fe(II)-dependent dioxygenase YbiX
MIKEEVAPGIIIYSDVIPNSENLYKDIEEGMSSAGFNWLDAMVRDGNDKHDGVNTMTRNTLTFGIPYLGKIEHRTDIDIKILFLENLNNIFFESFDTIERHYLNTYRIGTDWHDTYAILKYGPGQFFSNHIDDHPSYHRRVSTIYYLNDNYTGGEINFPRFDITIKPKANQMIVFPSTYVYNHSVSPVIEGERYAVVSWMK